MSGLPKQLGSANPMSSMKMTTMFGFSPFGLFRRSRFEAHRNSDKREDDQGVLLHFDGNSFHYSGSPWYQPNSLRHTFLRSIHDKHSNDYQWHAVSIQVGHATGESNRVSGARLQPSILGVVAPS